MHQSAQVLFYNDTWAQELGFDAPPTTWAEFKEQVCAASEFNANDDDPDNDGTGGFVLFPSASNILPLLAASGGDFVSDAGDAYTLNSPEMVETVLFLKDLFDSGCTLATDSFPNPEFATRKALIVTSSTAGVPFQASAFENAANDDVWSLRAFPGRDGDQAINAFGQLIGIVDTNEEQNLASWLFIKWLTSPETQAEWVNWTGYFPSQTSTLPLLGDYGDNNPLWAEGQELAPLGAGEPNLASYATVRGMIQDAGFAAMAAEDEAAVTAILDQLQADAEEAQAEFE
jgi:multiple sugar transport system substrate-binding protein